jgi:uncharacterized alkaline shock family protein YloU
LAKINYNKIRWRGYMNILFRIVLAVYAFCLALISAIVGFVSIKPDVFRDISTYIKYDMLGSTLARMITFLIALVFFALSITFLLSGVRSNKDKKAISKNTNFGEIRISLNSIENIALNTVKKFQSIREIKSKVYKIDETIAIVVNAVIMPDVNIPSMSQDVQARVKRSVEESTGIEVKEVKVVIDGIHTGNVYKARVE